METETQFQTYLPEYAIDLFPTVIPPVSKLQKHTSRGKGDRFRLSNAYRKDHFAGPSRNKSPSVFAYNLY